MSGESFSVAADFPPLGDDAWRALVEKDLKGKPFEALVTTVDANLRLEPLYTKSSAVDPERVGVPGVAPFVRGTGPLGKSEGGWIIRQEYDDPRMDVARDAIADDLAKGSHAVWVRLGIDHGVRVLTAGDLGVVFDAVDLAKTSVCLEPESDVLSIASAFVALADSKGVARHALVGCFGADPLGTLACTGRLPNGLEGSMRDAQDLAGFATKETPNVRALLANSRPYSDAGATAAQELGWTIATGVTYLRRLVDSGLSVEEASRQIFFAVSVGGPFFVDVAKLRAARWLWSKVVAASGGNTEAQAMELHARTATFSLAERDPWVNILRTTAEGFAAAIGGADSLSTSPFDSVLGPSDELARRVARNLQVVLRDEANLHRVADPAGGSYYVESLTEQLARAAWDEFVKVEAAGGMHQALSLGVIASALEATQERRVADLRKRKAPLVGISEFPNLGEATLVRASIDMNAVEGELGHRFGTANSDERHRAMMEFARVSQNESRGPGELVAAAIGATSLGVDLFSLAAVQRMGRAQVFAEPLPAYRAAAVFESLRDASDAYFVRTGRRPLAALLNLGPVAAHTARAMWMRNVLAAGGIETVDVTGFADSAGALDSYAASGADMAVFCGSDELYDSFVSELAGQLRGKGARVVAVAGKLGAKEPLFREKGVDLFVYAGADIHSILVTLHTQLGVPR